ncbi:MAG: lipoprotein [Paludibacteraceae bacterium]|nr:lipoprotein [Paludibacteraceae bacterium]
MKKYFIIAALFMLAACGQKSATQSQSQDSVQTADESKYISSDLQLFDLYGNVDSVTFDYETTHFDEKGKVCTANVAIERDEQGRIVKYEFGSIETVGDMWYEDQYSYNESGVVVKKIHSSIFSSQTITYSYDEAGHVKQSIAEVAAEGEVWKEEQNYTLLEFDDHGNWTKRKVEAPEEDASIEERQIYYRN